MGIFRAAMPLYEYECTKCGHRFEVIQKFSDLPKTECPQCQGPVEKLLSAPAIRFKGTGWYVTDYGTKKGGDEKEKPKTASDSKSSDSKKETKKESTKESKKKD